MENNKIILIGGDHYNGLSLVRLFGKNGYHPFGIIVGPSAKDGFLRESKYWQRVWAVEDDSQIIDVLTENFQNEDDKPVLIPWSDGAAFTIDLHLEKLRENFIVPSIDQQQSLLYKMMDKGRQVGFAHDCGLQIAESYEISFDESYSVDKVIIPCIVKPIVSCEGDKKDIRRCDSRKELSEYLIKLKEKGYHRILLQQYINIEKEFDVEGFIHKDQYTYFISEKVRTWPNIGGPMTYAFSVDNKALSGEIDKIVRHLSEINYSGLFDIDVFQVGDKFLFNEINWRNSAVCFAAVQSGVNYPLYWYCAVTGQDYEIKWPDVYGIYAMNELLDFQHVKSKKIKLMTWLKELKKSQTKAYFDKYDIAPLRKRFFMFLKRRVSERQV